MNNRIDMIRQLLTEQLQPTALDIVDDSHKHIGHAGAKDGGSHYTVNIASPLFSGKTRIQQHQLIYQALGGMMHTDIHALKINILKRLSFRNLEQE